IEARDRIGGRAFSSHSSSGIVVELGAEFIHGAHRETLDLLDRAGEPFLDLCDHHLFYDKGRRREIPDFWERIDRCNGLLNPKLKTDRSIADFIEARGGRWSPDLKKLYISYVEGFQAADIRKAGEKGLARAERGDEPELNSQAQFRPLHGYGAVMEFLKKEASLTEESLHLGSVLKEVRGDQRQIELLVQNAKSPEKRTYRAKKVVLTLPLSVLKTSVVFQPEISELVEALAPMEMGHVQRLTFQFADRFWEKLDDKPIGFLHTGPGDDFPTWWTQ
ncbi:MAG TPA: FAD-dependent oxidoreductase, partial [Pseudobdellovibrionaceae bacterium]|nr:FAD-dependent oxidoreductase [Pseudobdellovibrionaceae bacterium]